MRLTPGDKTMLGQDDGAGTRQLCDLSRQFEPGPDVRHYRNVWTERSVDVPLRLGVVRQGTDNVGMDVVDMPRRQEGVQERLNRGAARSWLYHAVCQVIDHLLVAHRRTRLQRP